MNKDNIKGKAKDISGRVERQVGEWTGDEKAQAEGLGKQAEGKVQKAWGDLKDAGKRVEQDVRGKREGGKVQAEEMDRDLDRKSKDEEAA